MRSASVQGLTPDGRTLLLLLDGEVVELSLAEVRQAQRAAPALPLDGAPSPREIQRRIRAGETADDIARECGLPVDAVAKFEGPVLAEREHHAQRARRSESDGRTVEDRVHEHAARLGAGPVSWDAFQTDPQRWEVRATAAELLVRLAWDPGARRADPVDEVARQALGQAPVPEEALQAVLRQVRIPRERRTPGAAGAAADVAASPPSPEPASELPPDPASDSLPDVPPDPALEAVLETVRSPRERRDPPAAGPRKRAQVPLWDDIAGGVSGGAMGGPRRPAREPGGEDPEG